jgi:hypothetical protein
MEKTLPGKLTIQIGINRNDDPDTETDTLLNLYLAYRYASWEVSLASAGYNTTNLSTVIDTENDLFLTLGYIWERRDLTTKVSLGTKFAFMEDTQNDRDNDYYASINIDYKLNDKYYLFAYYSYTISSDSQYIDYLNYHTVTLGSGYHPIPSWYTSLSYNYISTYYYNGPDYHTLSWFNAYMVSDQVYLSLNYAYGLNRDAYKHSLTFNIGAFFE